MVISGKNICEIWIEHLKLSETMVWEWNLEILCLYNRKSFI